MVLTWSVVLTVLTALVIGGFMMSWLRSHGKKTAESTPQELENVRVASKFISPKEEEAIALVKRALAVRDPLDVEKLFHTGGAKPAEIVEYFKGASARDGVMLRCDWLSSMDVEGMLMEGVLVAYRKDDLVSERLAFLVPDEKGEWKVDFDAFARSCKPTWSEFLEGSATHAEVRVFVAKDVYYNGPFLDESQWVCFAMASPEIKAYFPEDKELLRGYCKVGSPQAKAMERIFAEGGRMGRATLDIRKTAGADPRQFEISRVLAEDWVTSRLPFDERFN